MEFLVLIILFGYIFYLRNYADLGTPTEKEAAKLKDGIGLYNQGETEKAFDFFNEHLKLRPGSAISYLYRGLCYKKMGNNELAARDFATGISYDYQVADLYLEAGKLYQERNLLPEAIYHFNKAIEVSRGQIPEIYHIRGLAYQQMNLTEEAENDFRTEAGISQKLALEMASRGTTQTPGFDKKLLLNSFLVMITTAILLLAVKSASGIHLPYLAAVALSVAIGFVEPQRGWILAILQGIFLLAGYFLFTQLPPNPARQELENFALYGSIGLTFAASFLGAFFKRAFSS
ncbi:hypothetical protein DYBT9275_05625 [Dyadobacter sp. CECT 9275]|uniref:Tetratricopeptide repeat protein n=1 Tax=Dyadobacter helix TaxID=2822344 RepID=A0A916JK89_9BACT|nr:hypothetical protein [Dyadobacter sp. CECT 9275]CAG5016741.1 hypothetical protein DYBT9275_05625 [Dyadobacter sp. CECT 9275]